MVEEGDDEWSSVLKYLKVQRRQFQFGEVDMTLWCGFAEPAELVAQADHEDMTGVTVWPGAHVLCRYFYSNRSRVPFTRVVELGAGAGLCGLYAAQLGAPSVAITDINEIALECISRNIRSNPPPRSESEKDSIVAGSQVRVDHLFWGQELDASHAASYDLVVGAEVAYSVEAVGPLLDTVLALLAPPHHHSSSNMENDNSTTVLVPPGGGGGEGANDPPVALGASQTSDQDEQQQQPLSGFLLTHTTRFAAVDEALWDGARARGLTVERLCPIPPPTEPWSQHHLTRVGEDVWESGEVEVYLLQFAGAS